MGSQVFKVKGDVRARVHARDFNKIESEFARTRTERVTRARVCVG